ncbi:hypothetical protein BDA96_04G300600 [Sorghum bicolor]|uniref:Uncharacterized protein n=1 Tax=Sorghum bicolor TaxID=4558 RepID=A0A921UKQ3_SORBI|nr:hypothetical protein BDA96_04G300600 [Sorghum bicolor]
MVGTWQQATWVQTSDAPGVGGRWPPRFYKASRAVPALLATRNPDPHDHTVLCARLPHSPRYAARAHEP